MGGVHTRQVGRPPSTGSGETILTTTGDGTWTRPAGFDAANNVIEIIASGGAGVSSSASQAGSGGGGGQYARITDYNAAATENYHVGTVNGARGVAAAPGAGDSWFSAALTILYAQAGTTTVQNNTVPVPGGNASAVGSSTVRNGGSGAGADFSRYAGSGGGAAGNQTAVGGNGNGGGTSPGSTGGDGGDSSGGSNHGAGASGGSTGGAGTSQNTWTGSKGSGGGAGGGGGSSGTGGTGGNYGGGGGGGGYSSGAAGNGGQGIIVISWGANATTRKATF